MHAALQGEGPGWPLLHDHLLLSVKAQRADEDRAGIWGSVHTEALHESAVGVRALQRGRGAEACEALGLASEPRTVAAGRRPVMEVAGVPHELIRWTARRSEQIAVCLTDLEHEYVTATDDDGNLKFAPEVSERAGAKLNRIAAPQDPPREACGPFPRAAARGLAGQRGAFLAAGADLVDLRERARAAAERFGPGSPPWWTSAWRPSLHSRADVGTGSAVAPCSAASALYAHRRAPALRGLYGFPGT